MSIATAEDKVLHKYGDRVTLNEDGESYLPKPGTDGWTEPDFADSALDWDAIPGHVEIVDGVLLVMSPVGLQGAEPIGHLAFILQSELRQRGLRGLAAQNASLMLEIDRLPQPDLLVLTGEQLDEQRRRELDLHRRPAEFRPVLVKPELVAECISVGHERHDEVTKRSWYAEAGIRRYWLLDPADASLRCLILDDDATDYRDEASGNGSDVVHTDLFSGIDITLSEVFPA